ncbi:hypothetical protein [Wenzhouxiangella limi]|uniref:Zinc resistance-associated protein n=1 Tax=Wenzhouxiangella limi TaxID=2707351 RepID=A0A845URI8_9GAMM|nr:hypothetical protein [Wenzhouxiangella limi]NDY94187.1 hypothetical protein [Wenzhouxiangella limi]
MKKAHILNVLLVAGSLAVLALVFSSPIAAKPGWSNPEPGGLALSGAQRDQIANLRGAFHEKIKDLDWSVDDSGHDPETLQRARELRLALRAEIRDVLTEEQLEHIDSAQKRCPHGGKREQQPVRQQTTTLYL